MMSKRTDTEIDVDIASICDRVCDVVLADLDDMMSAHIPSVYNHSHTPHTSMKSLQHINRACAPPARPPNGNHHNTNTNDFNVSIRMRDDTDRHDCKTSHVPTSSPSRSLCQPSAAYSHDFVSVFRPNPPHRVELKDHAFISKDATFQLSRYIVHEEWGRDCVLLYKYLDYIFRCQLFSGQVFKLKHDQIGTYTRATTEYLLFHTGLHRRHDNECLYGLLAPNFISKTHSNKQKWRVMFGNIEESFLSQKEILIKFRGCNIPYLPQRTTFVESYMDSVFNPSYSIEVSWEERLIVNQDRIHRIIGEDAYFDRGHKHLKLTQLIESFDTALHATKRMLSFNPSLAVPQGFIDTKHCSFRMELLVPLIVKFPPRNYGKSYTFALAISKSTETIATYSVKSVLTLNMAYANARLVGAVDTLWLKYGNKSNK